MDKRYARHSLIDWFPMDRIARAKVGVIGAGATGNEVIKNLALLGIGEIHIYDFDQIEVHNLTRSVLYQTSDVGRLKAEAAAEAARSLDPNVNAVPHVGNFWDTLTLRDLRGFDVLFSCLDNFEARIKANMMCLLARTDFVNLAVDSRFCSVEVYPFSNPQLQACYQCPLPPAVYQQMQRRYSCGHLKKISFIERRIPTTIITASAAAALATSWALRMRDGAQSGSRKYFLDTISGESRVCSIARMAGCPGCGMVPAKPAPLLAVSRQIGDAQVKNATVTLSEGLLVSYSTAGTGPVPAFRRVTDLDSSFAQAVAPGDDTLLLDVRDQFTMDELVGQYSDQRLPVKFAVVSGDGDVVVWEFQ